MFSKRKKSWKANQKPCNERTRTRLGGDVDPLSQRSRIMVNGVTLLGLHGTFLRSRLLVFANMMENEFE